MKFRIYQIDMDKDLNAVAFQNFDNLTKWQGTPEPNPFIYDVVYDGEMDASGLEAIYRIFNTQRPESYTGRSLSVSDVVEVIESTDVEPGFYYCDSIGFKKIDFKFPFQFEVTEYVKGGTAVILWKDGEFYDDLTVKLSSDMPLPDGGAYLDENNLGNALLNYFEEAGFLFQTEFREKSGFCSYPLAYIDKEAVEHYLYHEEDTDESN